MPTKNEKLYYEILIQKYLEILRFLITSYFKIYVYCFINRQN